MGKQGAAARFLPAQTVPHHGLFDRQQNKVALTGKMLAERPGELLGGRKMDIAVAPVIRRAAQDPGAPRLMPRLCRTDLIECGHARFRLSLRDRIGGMALAQDGLPTVPEPGL